MHRYRLPALLVTLAAGLLLSGCNESDRKRSSTYYANTVSIDSSVRDDHWKSYATYVPYGTSRLEIRLHRLSQDADLFVAGPQRRDTCDSTEPGTRADTCVFYSPTPGEWLIDVIGWDYGRTYYTLTTTLSPSYKEASLWQIDAGVLSLQSTPLTTQAVNGELDAAESLLPILAAALDAAPNLTQGVHRHTLQRDGEPIGQVDLTLDREGDRHKLHIKAVRHTDDGQRQLLYTRADQPVTLDAHTGAVQSGGISLHLDNRTVDLRLGSDTGTVAGLQLIAEPGPAVRELQIGTLDSDGLHLEPR